MGLGARHVQLFRAVPLWLAACGLLVACSQEVPVRKNRLQQVQAAGVLRVAATYGRTTCYSGPQGLIGYECDLAQAAAKSIGTTAEVLFVRSTADALLAVEEGRADLAAATVTSAVVPQQKLRVTRSIDRVSPQLVYRMGSNRPRAPDELSGHLVVAEGDGHTEQLAFLKSAAPGLTVETTSNYDSEDLLYQVAKGEIDYTIASSTLVAINERYYPYLRTAFPMGEEQDVVFALKRDGDATLFDAVEQHLATLEGPTMARLHDRYYGHVEELDYFSAVQVANHMRSRLPRYLPMFKAVAERYKIDWRLLAAVGYQESHWDPAATSYTGVRGIMMLTNDTAQRYNVSNRDDPAQSIEGGARVLADIFESIPPEVPEPDRSWMALAAYNQGVGHLLDARQLTALRGGDSTQWLDVRDSYPLLSRPRWAAKLKYGPARGREAVDFVANVRAYYDLITMLASGIRVLPPPPLKLDQNLRTASAGREESMPPRGTAEVATTLDRTVDDLKPGVRPQLTTDDTLELELLPQPQHPPARALKLEDAAPREIGKDMGHSAE